VGIAIYRRTTFEIASGISVTRFSWVQCEGGGRRRGAVSGFYCRCVIASNCVKLDYIFGLFRCVQSEYL
jgi:hypothetical protein